MDIKETTTERTFQIDLNEEEMRYLLVIVGDITGIAFEDGYREEFGTPPKDSTFTGKLYDKVSKSLKQ